MGVEPSQKIVWIFFRNITKRGSLAKSWVFSANFKQRYDIMNLVETHVSQGALSDFRAIASREHLDTFCTSVSQSPLSISGNHGGEAILANKSLYCMPILQTVVVHQGPLSDSNVADPSAVAIARVKRAKAAHFQSVRDLVWWTARGGGSRSSFIRPDVVRQFMFLEPTQQLRCCP